MTGPRPRRTFYEADPTFMVRTTALPLTTVSDLGGGAAAHPRRVGYDDGAVEAAVRSLDEDLRRLVADPRIGRALYLSSSSLFDRLFDSRGVLAGPDRFARHRQALLRYLTRLAARPTPFGASAGIAVGHVGTATELEIDGLDAADVVVRLDAGYVAAVGRRLIDTATPPAAPLQWNETARPAGDRLVYQTRRSRLVEASVRIDPEVRRVLGDSPEGLTFGGCVERVVALGETVGDAERFVRALVAEGVLVCTALGAVTAGDPAERLVAEGWLGAGDGGSLRAGVAAVRASGGVPSRLEDARSVLPDPAGTTGGSELFHGSLVFEAPRLSLSRAAADRLLATAEVLRRCPSPPRDRFLERFARAFVRRFGEGTAVPFLDVFDTRHGLAIPGEPEPPPPDSLPADIALRSRGRAGEHEPVPGDEWLLAAAMASDGGTVDIAGLLPPAGGNEPPPPLPDAFCVIATFLSDSPASVPARPDVWFHRLVGPSGAQYLGRFGHWHPELAAGLERLHRREQALRPDVILAEVCHEPPGREINVVIRGRCHDYEIPLLGRGAAPADHQIRLQDLVVFVEQGRIRLWSQHLGRPIEPRLSCAHNFRATDCGAYRFLGALQFQDLRCTTEWNWGRMADWPQLPRIVAGSALLSPRQWRLRKTEIDQLRSSCPSARLRAVDQIRDTRGWGRFVMIGPPSQALLADLDTLGGAEMLCREVARRPASIIREADFFALSPLLSAPDGARHHEVVVSFMRSLPATAGPAAEAPSRIPSTAQHRHVPGGEWLFALVSCAPAAADELLTEVIGPLALDLIGDRACDRWFFIRYDEGGCHLRVRFHGSPAVLWGSALSRLRAELLARDNLWSGFELAEYRPEEDRYGGAAGLAAAERMFHADSEFVVQALPCLGSGSPEERSETCRLAVASTVRLFGDLGFDHRDQAEIVAAIAAGARRHVVLDTQAVRSIGRLYRHEREFTVGILTDRASCSPGVEDALERRSQRMVPVVGDLLQLRATGGLSRPFASIAASYVHMSLNRIFSHSQRQNEFVVASLLERGYREVTARFGVLAAGSSRR